tara:strand:- start:1239 stop:1922 length:684 start_codon:yes stop_codon:yes gene_type:complete
MKKEGQDKQSIALTSVKAVAVTLGVIILCSLFIKITLHSFSYGLPWLILPAFFLGYLIADFITGTIHWLCDSFFDEKTPVIGKFIIYPFREHHSHPLLITKDKFIEQDTTGFFIFIPFLYLATFNESSYIMSPNSIYGHSILIGICIGTFCTNLFHKWAHQRNQNFIIRKLQRLGIILNPDRHNKHHINHSKSYCVTSGLLNPALDRLSFYSNAERFIRLFTYEPRK